MTITKHGRTDEERQSQRRSQSHRVQVTNAAEIREGKGYEDFRKDHHSGLCLLSLTDASALCPLRLLHARNASFT